MFLDNKPYTFDRVSRIVAGILLLSGGIWLLGLLSDVLIPFAIALVLTYLINPFVTCVQKKIPNRVAAVLVSLFFVICTVGITLCVLIPIISNELHRMGQVLATVVETRKNSGHGAPSDIIRIIREIAARPEIQAFATPEKILSLLEETSRKLLPGVWGIITGTASFLIGLVGLSVIGLYLVFLLIDYDRIRKGWTELIPPHYREPVTSFLRDFQLIMSRYFRGQTLIAMIVGILFAAGFSLIGLPLGILFGIFVGILNLVPYLQLVALIPAAILAVFHSLDAGTNLWIVLGETAAVFVIVQTIQDTLLVPRIMGKVSGFNPVMILLSLSIWGKLLGIFGLIIALPISFLLLTYYRRSIAPPVEEAKPAQSSISP